MCVSGSLFLSFLFTCTLVTLSQWNSQWVSVSQSDGMKGANCKDALCEVTVGMKRRFSGEMRQMKSEYGMRRVVNGEWRVKSVQKLFLSATLSQWASDWRCLVPWTCFSELWVVQEMQSDGGRERKREERGQVLRTFLGPMRGTWSWSHFVLYPNRPFIVQMHNWVSNTLSKWSRHRGHKETIDESSEVKNASEATDTQGKRQSSCLTVLLLHSKGMKDGQSRSAFFEARREEWEKKDASLRKWERKRER